MTTRHPVTKAALALLILSSAGARGASANQNQEPEQAPVVDPAVPSMQPAVGLPPPPPGMQPVVAPSLPAAGPTLSASTDHDSVVGRWGIEARRLASPLRSQRGLFCGDAPCPVDLDAFGVRRWSSPKYAWSAGLALAVGGGSRREGGEAKTLDTFVGVGPTLSAHFLLANWKHLAVTSGPQLDVVFFAPSGSSPKTLLINLRGLVEGELHLGFIGLPALSLGLQTGIRAHFLRITKGSAPTEGQLASEWGLSTLGPTALWDLVTQTFVRLYF